MSEHPPHRIAIPPVPQDVTRPLWSVMIPTYNCAGYLRKTLTSVLEQDPGPDVMQIDVIDDCSTQDDPEAVVRELGRNRVGFYRQPHNVGYIRNFETCLLRSHGHIIHLLHGDDYVHHGFYHKLQQAFEHEPTIGAAFCRSLYIDEQGHWLSISPLEASESGILNHWLEIIATGQRLTTPSVVVRREVYENLGGFDRRFTCAGEDWEMWVRIATRYPVWFEVEPLAAYRVKREGSLTGDSNKTGALVRDMRQATEIIESYLPDYLPRQQATQLTRQARRTYAQWGMEAVQALFMEGRTREAIAQLQEALTCSPTSRTLRGILHLLLQEVVRRIRRRIRNAKSFLKTKTVGYQNTGS